MNYKKWYSIIRLVKEFKVLKDKPNPRIQIERVNVLLKLESNEALVLNDRGEQEMEAFLENGAQLSGNKNMYVVEYLPSAYSALAFGTTTIFLDNNKTFFD
ncbi:unnamed protein product [Rhizophagus irregularis]|nr:unnamed protein product [Rhizophagus irregularis]